MQQQRQCCRRAAAHAGLPKQRRGVPEVGAARAQPAALAHHPPRALQVPPRGAGSLGGGRGWRIDAETWGQPIADVVQPFSRLLLVTHLFGFKVCLAVRLPRRTETDWGTLPPLGIDSACVQGDVLLNVVVVSVSAPALVLACCTSHATCTMTCIHQRQAHTGQAAHRFGLAAVSGPKLWSFLFVSLWHLIAQPCRCRDWRTCVAAFSWGCSGVPATAGMSLAGC